MTEVELIELGRSATENIAGLFGQIITITFAMIVAIYYFLNRSKIALKALAFAVYMIGMLLYFALMLIESNLKVGVYMALKALPPGQLSSVGQRYVGLSDTWLAVVTSVLINGAFHVLWLGVAYLLFFWKKDAHETASATSAKVTSP